MRIALLTYSTKPRGGVVHTLALAEALAAAGEHVDVWTLSRGGDDTFFRTVDPAVGLRVVPFPAVDGESVGERIIRSIATLRAAFTPGAYDIVHAQDCISANAVDDCIRTVHHLDTFTTPELVACHERAIVRPRALVCVSAAVAGEVLAGWGRTATVIPNGVDSARFEAAASEAPDARSARARWRTRLGPFILAVGGIEPRKGSLDLLEAYALLRAAPTPPSGPATAIPPAGSPTPATAAGGGGVAPVSGGRAEFGVSAVSSGGPVGVCGGGAAGGVGAVSGGAAGGVGAVSGGAAGGVGAVSSGGPVLGGGADVRLVFAGGETLFDYSDYRAQFEARAAELGIEYTLLGTIPDPELPSLIAAADVLSFVSTKEGFGLAAMEALAAGVPVVARDLPVLREVFGPTVTYAATVPAIAAALAAALPATGTASPVASANRAASAVASAASTATRTVSSAASTATRTVSSAAPASASAASASASATPATVSATSVALPATSATRGASSVASPATSATRSAAASPATSAGSPTATKAPGALSAARERGRELARGYSWEVAAASHRELYRGLIAERGVGRRA